MRVRGGVSGYLRKRGDGYIRAYGRTGVGTGLRKEADTNGPGHSQGVTGPAQSWFTAPGEGA
jgi:hypothetical protein